MAYPDREHRYRTSRITEAGSRRRRQNGLTFARPTRPQAEFCADDAPYALWRDGNGLGKSWALAKIAIDNCRGVSTERAKFPHRPPVQVLVISVSRGQMYPLHEKIHDLLPKHEVADTYAFIPGRGIKGAPPFVTFKDGPGKGSEIHFRTYKQGSDILAGIHPTLIILDEPPPEPIFGEVQGRIGIARGELRIGMTPTPDMPDMAYLRKLVARGEVSEHNHGLVESNCWPKGYPAPWIFQDEIDAYERKLLRVQREMRMRGAWDPVFEGLYLPDFDPARHVRDDMLPPPGALVFIGIDHGEAPGKQAMVLGAISGAHSRNPFVWFLDEVRHEGVRTSPEQDARDLFRMLLRNGLTLDNIDLIIGDRSTANGRRDAYKSNKDLRFALADIVSTARRQVNVESVPAIIPPSKGSGSVLYGCESINVLFMRDRCIVHPRCVNLIASMQQFNGDPRHVLKDVLDAGRYPVQHALGRRLVQLEARY